MNSGMRILKLGFVVSLLIIAGALILVDRDPEPPVCADNPGMPALTSENRGDDCGPVHTLIRGGAFECELPSPDGFAQPSWRVISGMLPPGLSLEQDGARWSIEGTVSQEAPTEVYSVEVAPMADGKRVDHNQTVAFNIGIPFRTWAQNMILLPNNPFTNNIGGDNEERARLLLNRINQYDIIALQEVIDDDQRSQLEEGAEQCGYVPVFGPTKESYTLGITTTDDSGLLLLVREALSSSGSFVDTRQTLSQNNQSELFSTECQDDDCFAHKGFSVSKVFLDPEQRGAFVFVVNTHAQASYDSDDQYKETRAAQLAEIIDFLSAPDYLTHPALLLGDLNIVDGSAEYVSQFGADGPLDDWENIVSTRIQNSEEAFTIDATRNAYAHFWKGDHLSEHECEALSPIARIIRRCPESIVHPSTRKRLDYILVRQGTTYGLIADSVQIEDDDVLTELCRDAFPMSDHPDLTCYLSDHYGISANLVFLKNGP
jgi:endonuclease/exonuclease/phosphatase family metal-dependent hydrolase